MRRGRSADVTHDMESDNEALVGYLSGRDTPCPVCGHNLRDRREALCAECGSPLSLAVTSSRLRPGPWLLAFGSFVLALGFDGVTTLLMFVPFVVFGPPASGTPTQYIMVLVMMAGLSVVCAASAVVLFKNQRAWRRRAPRTQWFVAISLFTGVGVLHVFAGALSVLWLM